MELTPPLLQRREELTTPLDKRVMKEQSTPQTERGMEELITPSRRAGELTTPLTGTQEHRKGDHRIADHSSNGQREDVASPESTLPRASALNASVSPSDDDRRSRKRPSDYTVEDQAKRIKLDSRKWLLFPVGSSSK